MNPRTADGKTPLAMALARGHGEAADVLRGHGGLECESPSDLLARTVV